MACNRGIANKRLRAQFEFLDSDKSGEIDSEEFMLFKAAQVCHNLINDAMQHVALL